MRWREGGRVVQEATSFPVGTKADRARAEELLSERTMINRLKLRRDKLAVLIAERDELTAKIERLQAKASPLPVREMLRLGGLVDAWERSPWRKDCSEVQRARGAARLSAFVAWAGGDVLLAAVDDRMAAEYASELGARVSGLTFNAHLHTLTAAWKAVGRAEGLKHNPWAELAPKRPETHSRRVLAHEEVERILATAAGDVRALILAGLRLGLRIGDAARLRWEVFRSDDSAEIKTSKTGAVVRLPAGKLLDELAASGFERRESGFIMPRLAEMYERDPSQVSRAVVRVFKAAGIETSDRREGWGRARPTATFHSLRHTFVTRAIEAGVPAAIVQALVGHATAAMTEHYTHVSAAAVLDAFTRAGV
jgi:integrase